MVFGHTRVYLSHTQILARYELTCKYHNALKLPTSVTCCQESCTERVRAHQSCAWVRVRCGHIKYIGVFGRWRSRAVKLGDFVVLTFEWVPHLNLPTNRHEIRIQNVMIHTLYNSLFSSNPYRHSLT